MIWVPNGWRTPALFTAIWRIGAIVVPFDREMNVEAARAILNLVRPALVITGYAQRPSWSPDAGVEEWWDPDLTRVNASAPILVPDGDRVWQRVYPEAFGKSALGVRTDG